MSSRSSCRSPTPAVNIEYQPRTAVRTPVLNAEKLLPKDTQSVLLLASKFITPMGMDSWSIFAILRRPI